MTEEEARWAAELFQQAVELPPEKRRAFLQEACVGRGTVFREVESLLAADDVAEERLRSSGGGEEVLEDEGRRIGAYRILGELGEGGMSVVYRARRDDGELHRQVALKVIRPELLSPELVRRFETERQILANLEHPAIARLYDAGRTEDGTPYFVMERIEGLPIDEYCRQARSTVEERVRLLRQVCSAVHYAHQNLVIHRDIKPSNLLVTSAGQPKLLDFGIAKVLDPDPERRGGETTRRWERLLTPEYASPEQLLGLPVTTASDVYSLGALLFKILTGEVPFAFAGREVGEIERLISATAPPRPSLTARRRREAGAILEAIDSSLDSIAAMALAREPELRYASAEQMGEDLERYLAGLPVRAHGRSLRYRAGKFLRRHRLGVGLTASALVLVSAAGGMLGLQAKRLGRERQQALRERERAAAVTAFVADLDIADAQRGEHVQGVAHGT